jgi:hypothetical protein
MGETRRFRSFAGQPSNREARPDADIRPVHKSTRPCENSGSGADDCLPIRLDVLSECSEPGNSVCEDLLNAVTLDNVSELISAAFRRGC